MGAYCLKSVGSDGWERCCGGRWRCGLYLVALAVASSEAKATTMADGKLANVIPLDVGGGSRSSKSKRSSIVGGPQTIAGIIFIKIKRCAFCTLRNCDPNPIRIGPNGVEAIAWLIWGRGTSQNPEGRCCRICILVWTVGGFCTENEDIDAFLVARRAGGPNGTLQKQWDAAWKKMVQFLGEKGIERLKGPTKSSAGLQLQEERAKVVKAYQRSEVKIFRSYYAVFEEDFEEAEPGGVQQRSLKVVTLEVGGKERSVILFPKNKGTGQFPQQLDYFEVEEADITGVQQEEVIDQGNIVLRDDQQECKFRALAGANRKPMETAQQNAQAAAASSRPTTTAEGDEASAGDSDSGSDSDGFSLVCKSSLIRSVASTPAQGKSKGGASSTLKLKRGAGEPSASRSSCPVPASSPAKVKDPPPAVKQEPQQASPAGKGRTTISTKMQGKDPDEILSKHGLKEIKVKIDKIIDTLSNPPYTTAAIGDDYVKLQSNVKELRKATSALQKAAVNLDIKVRKWKDVPKEVNAVIKHWRGTSMALNEALIVLVPDSKKGGDATKMELCLSKLEQLEQLNVVPIAFRVQFFRERAADLIRFGNVAEFIEFASPASSYLSSFADCMDIDALEQVHEDVIGDALGKLSEGWSASRVEQDQVTHIKHKCVLYRLRIDSSGHIFLKQFLIKRKRNRSGSPEIDIDCCCLLRGRCQLFACSPERLEVVAHHLVGSYSKL